MTNTWTQGWKESHAPRKDLRPSEWAAQNVYLANSPIGAKFQPGGHCDAILDDLADPEVYEACAVGHTGMGKSAILECASCWIVAQAPGPTLVLGQTDKTVEEWMETRMKPALAKCEATRRIIPEGADRHKNRKDAVIFRHMEYLAGGANLTNTQEKSMRYTLGDEAWAWKHGIIGEFLKRHHDRWNRKSLIVSQAGFEDDDWHTHTKQGLGFDRGFICPSCGHEQTNKWSQVKFESLKDANDEWDWPAIRPTVHYECENPECGAAFEDTAKGRRERLEQAVYICRNNSHIPGRVTRYIPAMANPRIELFTLVKEWLLAQDDLAKGDKTKLRQFIQKRLAQFWVEKPEVPTLKTDDDPYRAAEYADGSKWEKEHFRFLTIDVQKDHFWARVRCWALDGSSRGIYEGKLTAWENIRAVQEKFQIPNRCVFIDSRYMPEEVAKNRMRLRGDDPKFLWNMIMGEGVKGYSVANAKGKKLLRTYSSIMRARSQAGVLYEFFKFSNLRAKDQLASLMAGNGSYFGIEIDHSKEYAKQMASEHRVMVGKDFQWKPIKEHFPNHLWDCEVMQIVAACVFKCLGGLVEDE
jgi:hypothetical protein